jgi:hypothetical protein
MPILDRRPTQVSSCNCCGAPVRTIAGQLQVHGGEPLFIAQLRDHDGSPKLYTVLLIGPWDPRDGSDGAGIFLYSELRGGNVGSAIVDCDDLVWGDTPFPPAMRRMTRTEVFARDGAAPYFFASIESLLRDKEIRSFLLAAG